MSVIAKAAVCAGVFAASMVAVVVLACAQEQPDAGRLDAARRELDALMGREAAPPVEASPGDGLASYVEPEKCTYTAYAWDTRNKLATGAYTVSKPYSEVTGEERDPSVYSCSICSEDQRRIDPHDFGLDLPPIRICHLYERPVREALAAIVAGGEFDIVQLEGYRPGRTRGKIDKNGLRTEWSRHSFGTAIDINARHNAIYSNCTRRINNSANDVRGCRKGIGGAYNPEQYPRVSIVKDGPVYREMTKFWKWGGEIAGDTKDIMHFSVTGL